MGKWMDQRRPLLQRSYRILVGRRACESDLLGRTGCGRSRSYCLM